MKAYYRKVESKKLGRGISWRCYRNAKSCSCVKKHLQHGRVSRRLQGMD
jgi:hypothetical protein